MGNPWKDRVLAYNKTLAERKEKAQDMDVMVEEILELPPGQLKKVLSARVLAVLAKYGYEGVSG